MRMSTFVRNERFSCAELPDERLSGPRRALRRELNYVAAHLSGGKDSIYRWVESRGLPARKVERLLRFKLSQVDAKNSTRPRRGMKCERRRHDR